jgi:glycine/D-amino acid oxidase-like deaminating enzyme
VTDTSARASVVVVGAGLIGRTVAWWLIEQGQPVALVDPSLEEGSDPERAALSLSGSPTRLHGSQAALGVLMARVFHRSSGRAWRLRQQSHALWEAWLSLLEQRGHRLPRRRGLLLLAATAEELAHQERLAADRARLGIPLRRLDAAALERLWPTLPGRPLGGLLSPEDGQLDPGPVLEALLSDARRRGLSCLAQRAVGVERGTGPGGRWRLLLADGEALETDWLVLAPGPGAWPLLAALGHAVPLAPVLGQALELELRPEPGEDPPWNWPGVVVWRGRNLVPRPERAGGGRRLWLGATLEPGELAGDEALRDLRALGGEAPPWLREAVVARQWQGLRYRPLNQPAPVHQEPEPGLLITCGHYRNGVLLAPATAEWVSERIGGRVRQERRRRGGVSVETTTDEPIREDADGRV